MNPDVINYEPLDGMKHAWSHVMRTGLGGFAWLVAILVLVVGIVLSILTGVPHFTFFALFACFAYAGTMVRKYKNSVWENFASSNNWDYDPEGASNYDIPPSAQFGHSPHSSPIIHAQINSQNCDLLSYDCTVGYGRNSQTYYFTIALTSAPKPFPHMLLRSKKGITGLQNDLADMEKLKLEGDFDDYFSLQIEKGQEVDVLTVITPDVMQTLVSYGTNENIEIVGSNIYFILSGDKRDPDDVRKLIRSVVELSGQLNENVRLSTVQPAAQPTQATSVSPVPPILPPEGQIISGT